VAEFAGHIAVARRAGMRTLVPSLAGKHELAAGLDIERATDVHYLLHSHETYLGLVIGTGWTMEEYKAWLNLTLCEQLLNPGPGGTSPAPPPAWPFTPPTDLAQEAGQRAQLTSLTIKAPLRAARRSYAAGVPVGQPASSRIIHTEPAVSTAPMQGIPTHT
jgi:hypothetical protein